MYLRKTIATIMAIMLAISLAACGGSTPAPSSAAAESAAPAPEASASESAPAEVPAGKTAVTFWNGFTGGDREYLEKLVSDFNDKSETTFIDMNIMPWDVLGQKLASSYAVDQGPDLCGAGKDTLEQYADLGALYDVSDYFGNFDINLLQPALVDNITMAGAPRGVPLNFGTIMLFYNKDMFAAENLNPPTDWAELEDCAVKLTKINGGTVEQYGLAIGTKQTIENWGVFIWGNGGDILDAGGKAVCNSPEAVEAVERWANLIKEKQISPPVLTGVECDQLFQNQKAAMYICGPWVTTPLEKAGVNFGVVDMPKGPKAQVTVANGSVIAMAKTADAKKANVYEFYDHWVSKESQAYWSTSVGFAPIRNDMLDDPALKDSKWVLPFTETAQYARFFLPGGTKFPQVNDALINAYEQVLLGEASAKDALDGAAQEIDGIMG